jgi:hypothetical protein
VKKSNTANVDPRSINFADVKRRLEDKIDKINSYQSKKGTFRENPEGNKPSFSPQEQPSSSFADQNQSKFQPSQNASPAWKKPQENSRDSGGFGASPQPQSSFGSQQPQGFQEPQSSFGSQQHGVGTLNKKSAPIYNNTIRNRNDNQQRDSAYKQTPQAQKYQPQEYANPINSSQEAKNFANIPQQQQWGYNNKFATPRSAEEQNANFSDSRNDVSSHQDSKEGYYDIHKKLDFLEQERLHDLRSRAEDSKLSGFSRNLEKIEGKIENLQNYPVSNNFATSTTDSFDNSKNDHYDIHKKLDFLEQERLHDLRLRAEDSKLSGLARNLEKVEGKIENLQSSPIANNLATSTDVSLELIQRKLDKLEQDRIDSLRSKIEEERSKEIKKSIGKLEAKFDNKEAIPQNRQSTGLLELIQRKIERLEEDRIDSLKARIEEDRNSEIIKNLSKIESKIAESTDKSPIAQTAYLDVLSQEDLLRKLEKLEQDRVHDLKGIMEQEKILLLNKKIESLESKIDKNIAVPYIDNTIEITRKLERLEQNKIEELKAQKEEEKLISLSKSLSNIESKLEGTHNSKTQNSGVIEHLLSEIVNRLDKLEKNKESSGNASPESSSLEKTIEKLESKIEKALHHVDVLPPMDIKYATALEAIEKKLDRLEKDRVDDFKERSEENRLSNLERSLERIEDSLISYQRSPYATFSERDGFGKKFDRLEQNFEENYDSGHSLEIADSLQKSLHNIESKLESISGTSKDASANGDNLPPAFLDLSNRLEQIEKKRAEDNKAHIKDNENSKLMQILENIDSKLNTSVLNSHLLPSREKSDFIMEDIKSKLNKIEESQVNELLMKWEDDKYNKLTNHLEKLEAKISNNSQNIDTNSISQISEKIAELGYKLEKREEKSKYDNLPTAFLDLSNRLEQIEKKRSEDNKSNITDNANSKLTQILENIDAKLNTSVLNSHLLPSKEKSDFVIEDIQSKLNKLEEAKANDLVMQLENEKYDKLTNHLEKLESKISDISQQAPLTSPSVDTTIEDIKSKLNKLEEAKANDLVMQLENEKYDKLTNHLEKLESKIYDNLQNVDANSISQISEKISELGSKLDKREEKSKDLINLNAFDRLTDKISDLTSIVAQKEAPIINTSMADVSQRSLQNIIPQPVVVVQKEDANSKVLLDIKDSVENLSKNLDNSSKDSGFDKAIAEIQQKISKLEESNPKEVVAKDTSSHLGENTVIIAQELIDKNNAVLENIFFYLKDLTEEFKNLYATKIRNNSDLNNENTLIFLENLHNKYLDSLQKVESSLKESYKSDEDFKKYLLDQDLNAVEISKLQNDLLSKKNSAQTSFLLNEINKIKKHIDAKNLISTDLPNEVSVTLNDIKSQQESIKKFLETLTLGVIKSESASKDNSPLIGDIKNLLSEVNYRNEVLSVTVDDSQNRLSNVLNKVDHLSSSFSKIEDLVNKISSSGNLSGEYKESLEENFAKLKKDNYRIIEVLNNNSMQSNLLSEKSNIFIKALRDDIVNISKLEQKSILEEFSNVKSSIEEFTKLLEQQDVSSLGNVLSNLDSITNVQEDTLNYFKSLDSNIKKMPDLGNSSLISEVKLYLEDSKSRVQYFNQLKDKIDQNNIIITNFLSKPEDASSTIIDFTSSFKSTLEGLSKTISYLLENHNKTSKDLVSLIEKTDKIISSDTSTLIDEKTNDMQLLITDIITSLDNNLVDKVVALNTNIDKSKEEISILIKDSSYTASNKTKEMQKDLSIVHADINTISSKPYVALDIKELNDNVLDTKKEVETISDNSLNKLIDLQEEISQVNSEFKILSYKADDIKDTKSYLKDVSENIKIVISSIESINLSSTVKNISEKVLILKDNQKQIENLIGGFQKEINSNLSPYLVDKHFLENFSKFTNFSTENIQNIKDSIQLFNTSLDTYLFEDKSITNDELISLLTNFEKIIDLQDNFFKVYTLNSDRLMGFAKKVEDAIPEVDIAKAEKIHLTIQKSIVDVSLKNKKENINNLVELNNAKNSKKIDLLANMDYLNKEITQKTKK